ncbi:MAG: hypothetical protein HKN08_00780, partial [Gammaproteobacteria bacterium]|nr:hypothetical protein [Gammaproteobacteria bacterium]
MEHNSSEGCVNMDRMPVYPLSPTGEEVVFAPFHDPEISASLEYKLNKLSASECNVSTFWCYTDLVWKSNEAGTVATEFFLCSNVNVSAFNDLIFCLSAPVDVDFSICICVDGKWIDGNTCY